MKTSLLLILTIILISNCAISQTKTEIIIPAFSDKYSDYIRKLEAGQTDIDYGDFRFSFIESEQFKIAANKSAEFDSLKKEMLLQMEKSNYSETLVLTKKMLSIDYTSMIAHKILRQTYKIIGDTVSAARYKAIQFGLLNSIIIKGSGQSCRDAWPVIQISEEYFILEMIGAKLKTQKTDNDGGMCDKMEVVVDGADKTYFFETSKVFEGYKKLGFK